MRFNKYIWFLILFNVAYIIPFTIFYLMIGNFEFMIYIGVLVFVALLVLITLDKTKLDNLALWGLSIWGLLHMMGGGIKINGETLYRLKIVEIFNGGGDFFILKMDQAIHFYGFAVAAIVVYQLIKLGWKEIDKYKLPIFLAFIGSMGLGALNEVVEFLAFVFVEKTGVGDLYNTGLDLIFNLLGAWFGAVFAGRWEKIKTRKLIS